MTHNDTPKDSIQCLVNGVKQDFHLNSMKRLLDFIRQDCGLTGTKEGCGEGECGACAVLVDGELVNSCLVPVAQVQGRSITTIEGAFDSELGQRIQKSFLHKGATQCGACTPGMVMASLVLLRANNTPSLDEIKRSLAGNLCRCTGYTKIFAGILDAANSAEAEHD